MSLDKAEIEQEIKSKIIEIVSVLGMDASGLGVEDIIPATGLVDSAALLELIAWFENHYAIPLSQEEITIDNLGSLSLMADFAIKKKS